MPSGLGVFLKEAALAAVTVSAPVDLRTHRHSRRAHTGDNILIAQCVGAHALQSVNRLVQTSIVLVGALSVLLLTAAQLTAGRMLHLLNTPAEIYPDGLWLPAHLAVDDSLHLRHLPLGSMLRGIGDSKTPVYFQTVSVLLNAALDPLLMLGKLHFPHLGVNGAAWATLIAQATAVIALLYYVSHRRRLVWPDLRRRQIDNATAMTLIVVGLPAMVQQSVVSISLLGIVHYISRFGTFADAAFGAALRIDNVAYLPALNMGLAVATVAGQNIGASCFGRVREVFRWGMLLSVSISLIISALAITAPEVFLRIFVREPHVLAIGAAICASSGITYALYAVMFVSNGIINGAGQTLATSVISVLALLLIRLPLAGWLPHFTHDETGIWYAMLISVAAGTLMSLGYYFSGLLEISHRRPGLALRTASCSHGRGKAMLLFF